MRWVAPAAALGLLFALTTTRTGERMRSKPPSDNLEGLMRAIIARAAQTHGVPIHVAHAYAWLESRFDSKAEGDLAWATWDHGARYRKYVLEARKFAHNPYRLMPELWHSYGLFQLLAPHFIGPQEDPRVLLDPEINADRGCKYIATCLRKARGDVRLARLYYAGATKLDEPAQAALLAKMDQALTRFPAA